MDIVNTIKILQTEASFSFPISYIKYRQDQQNNNEFPDLYQNGSFVDSYKEAFEFMNSSQFPKDLFPFFVNKKSGESGGVQFDDIYCFVLEKSNPDYSVVVVSIHTVVADWKNFYAWVDWSRGKQANLAGIPNNEHIF